MKVKRRTFLKQAAGVSSLRHSLVEIRLQRLPACRSAQDQSGVLVDTTLCVGCRSCEKACNEINEDLPRKPAGSFKDESVFENRRRMDYSAYTVVNRYENDNDLKKPVYAKFECMHCLYPACSCLHCWGLLPGKRTELFLLIRECIGY